jgi:hypothetical protein
MTSHAWSDALEAMVSLPIDDRLVEGAAGSWIAGARRSVALTELIGNTMPRPASDNRQRSSGTSYTKRSEVRADANATTEVLEVLGGMRPDVNAAVLRQLHSSMDVQME